MGTRVCWRHGEGCVSVTVRDECVEGRVNGSRLCGQMWGRALTSVHVTVGEGSHMCGENRHDCDFTCTRGARRKATCGYGGVGTSLTDKGRGC